MVSAKGKVQSGINSVNEDAQCHKTEKVVRNFKVHPDNRKIKLDVSSLSIRESIVPVRNISAPLKKGALLPTANDLKGGSKVTVKFKGKSVSSANQDAKVKRKALADVSNVQTRFLKNVMCDGSKMKILTDTSSRTVNISSRKCSLGRTNISQRLGYSHATKKGVKDLSACSDKESTNAKNSGQESAVYNLRRTARNSLGSVRNSLPVLMTAKKADSCSTKNKDEGSELANKNRSFSGKAKMSKNVIPQVSTCRSYLQRNRGSDGFLNLAARNQSNVNAPHFSKKFIKPSVKTATSMSNANTTSRSKGTTITRKSISIATISSKKKKEPMKPSLVKLIPVVVSCETTQEPPSDSNSKLTNEKLDAIVWKKSDRRRSYTSSLMARSKLLVECGEIIKHEKVPCIDDDCNHLEVAEYVDEIYQFYWVSETQNLSPANCMSIQTEITPQMRGILINWLIEVHFKFELMQETLYLMVILLDQYLCQVKIKKNEMQLVGLTSLLLASKYEDFWHPRIKDLLSISAESYTRDQMLVMEKLILKKLKFRLNAPTPYVFMIRFLKAAQSDLKLEHLAFYLIELCLVEYEALKFKPSMLCASAIYVARSTLQMTPAWTPLLAKHARYEVSQLRDCAEMILRFQTAARASHLNVTYEKYKTSEFSSVAALKPLDNLPP